jgi:hypothetical protein
MSFNTLAAIDAAVKESYPIGTFEKQYSEQKEFYKRIEKLSTSDFQEIDMGGRRSVIPIMNGRLFGRGWRAEGGALPDATQAQVANMYVSSKSIYVRTSITGQAIKQAEQDWEAFMPSLRMLQEGMDESVKKKFNFALYRKSTGAITQVNGAVSDSTSVTVDSTRGLEPGMYIDTYTTETAGTQEVDSVKISSISGLVLTLAEAVSITDDAYVFEAGDQNNAINGLIDNLAVTGEIHGVNRATATWSTGNVVSSTVGTIADADLKALKTAALKQKNEEPGRFWMTTFEVADQVWDKILRGDIRHSNTVKIAGGVETFTHHGYPFVTENDCQAGYLYLIDPTVVKLLRVMDFEYILNAGSQLHPVSGYDAVEMALRSYCNLLVTRPNAIPYSYGITEA